MAAEQTFRQWATHDVTQLEQICINDSVMENFELKTGFIHRLPLFRGLENEDPHKFLKEFHVVCSRLKPHNVTDDQIKLRAFPFALQDSAKEWFYYLQPGSVTTWNDLAKLFLEEYFPEVKASILRKEIIGIKQAKREALHTYYDRFKNLCARCPQHGISEHQLLQFFYEGLAPLERRLINASSGGALSDKTPTQIRALITSIVEDTKRSNASLLRKEIIGITQAKREAFHTYWDRFKKLCARCPQHGLSEHQLLWYFCEGLTPLERRLINASSGGTLLDKTPIQLRALITSIAKDTKHWATDEEEWYVDTPRGVKEASTPHIENQLVELTKAAMQLTKDKGVEPTTRACTNMCPMSQEYMGQTQTQTMGGYLGHKSKQYESP